MHPIRQPGTDGITRSGADFWRCLGLFYTQDRVERAPCPRAFDVLEPGIFE
jgi:hypothetical protein